MLGDVLQVVASIETVDRAALGVHQIQGQASRGAVAEHDRQAGPGYCLAGGDEAVGRNDDLASRRKLKRFQGDFQGIGAVADAEAKSCLLVGSELLFELPAILPADERGAGNHRGDGGIYFALDGVVLLVQIDELDHAVLISAALTTYIFSPCSSK